MTADKQRAHALVDDRVHADPMTAAVRFLEFLLLDPVDRALATAPWKTKRSARKKGRPSPAPRSGSSNNEGIPFGQAATDLGFAMGQFPKVLMLQFQVAGAETGTQRVLAGSRPFEVRGKS